MNAPLTVQCGAPADGAHEVLARLLEILAHGKADVVAFLKCYFDESGSHEGSPVLCLAGYVFDKDQCKVLDVGWKEILDRYRLPYFRMSACAHRAPPFDHLSPQECIDAEKAAIALINNHALLGVAAAVNEAEYQSMFGDNSPGGSPYAYLCWQVLAGIRAWVNRTNFQGDIAYFYEAGHASQREANALMKRIFDHRELREGYRYANHSFVDKQKVRPVQTADILAWQFATQMKRWINKDRRMRADFRALAEKPPHELFLADRKTLAGPVAYHRWLQRLPVEGITGSFGYRWFWSSYDGRDGLVI